MSSDDITTLSNNINKFCDKREAVFAARCEARAHLWQAGEFDLHTAVDALERFARKLRLDTDLAQSIMARSFAAVRDDL